LISEGDLGGVVSDVSRDEFDHEALPRNLENLDWLERVARAHDAVVQAVGSVGAVLPLRLGAVYLDDSSALRRVGELRTSARAALDLVSDREEWGIKLFAIPMPAEPQRASSGLEYLRRRRAELDQHAAETAAAGADAEAVFARLGALAVRSYRHRPQNPALSGVGHPMVLNAAFLVDRAVVPEFQDEARSLATDRPDGAVVLTGPWAPYSFATLDEP
jgi:hypothetical protein